MNNYQLPPSKLKALRAEHRRAKQLGTAQMADKIKAVYLMGSGWMIPAICEALLLDENTLYQLL